MVYIHSNKLNFSHYTAEPNIMSMHGRFLFPVTFYLKCASQLLDSLNGRGAAFISLLSTAREMLRVLRKERERETKTKGVR